MAYASVTRAQLRARLQTRYDATAFWTATEANDALNEALRWFNLYTGYWRGTTTVVTAAGGVFLTVGASLTAQSRVTRAGKVLTRKSILGLYRQRRGWRTQTTASGGEVPTTVREWAPVGLTGIAIWPADAAGGLTLTIDGVKITPILTADGQFVDAGENVLDSIVDEAIWILSFKQPSQQAAMKKFHQDFLQECLGMNDQLRQSSYFRRELGLDSELGLKPIRRGVDQAGASQATGGDGS